jgi:hypothetical protein
VHCKDHLIQLMPLMGPEIRHAVLGNAGTIISFRVGVEDAPYLQQEFGERFEQFDLTHSETITST